MAHFGEGGAVGRTGGGSPVGAGGAAATVQAAVRVATKPAIHTATWSGDLR